MIVEISRNKYLKYIKIKTNIFIQVFILDTFLILKL